ncbi:valine--tRNA ligase [Xylanibacter rodentium]|uniref:Valine--tRNA ligase n=3 Tax=Xylanibacter rodentium TaxID=2736289 RepID=A0ABX2ASV7_9BACT|nr:valine--tRNA ligase [Xylanibacter rodentium]NPE10126.1 valine--tRNA ligase [Prevotella sp. PJ1A]NPE12783.1 valine--tRNA ligase [Xylanibacter rodentium]NPE38402.1 valine--tRNA ligase [Prevotella sp. PCJ2]
MELASKYDPQAVESKWYQYWLDNKLFSSKPDSREPYTIVIPPPNVTGVLHMGHMLNNTIQDILVRRARMEGKNACWVPGTDHASIATEAKVVNKLAQQGIKKTDLTRDEFLRHAWDWTNEHGGIILKQLRRLGASCDWDRTAFTMDDKRSEGVIKVFCDLYDKGLIYRGARMVNWDPQAQTALSDEEVIYKEEHSKLYYLRYMVAGEPGKYAIVATTRPETIMGDTAMCINPADPKNQWLRGKRVIVPLVGREIPVIEDDYVDIEFGTGCLKVTPAHDINDHALGLKHNLETIDIFNDNGTISEAAGMYVGMDRMDVRRQIEQDLNDAGLMEKVEDYNNKVGYSERTNVPIEPKLSTQWFLSMKHFADISLDPVMTDEVQFYPAKYKNTYRHWLENIKDWCISRQLWWGHRIPAYYFTTAEGKRDFVVARSAEEALAEAQKKNAALTAAGLEQDEDCLDTWFSSWLWPISVFDGVNNPDNEEVKYYYPTSDLVTGPDIIFFWVARMIMAGYEYRGTFPFKHVYFTGIVRDKLGRKMSKSLGNSPDPLMLIDKYGADGVRMGMMLSAPAGNDILFDEGLCEQGRNFNNKIWNAFRLVKGWQVAECGQPAANATATQWFEAKLKQTNAEVDDLFRKYRISEALMAVYRLFWDEFSSWYLEMIKPAYGQPIDKKTYDATIQFFETLLKMLHPFMPFITEELWQHICDRKDGESIMRDKLEMAAMTADEERLAADIECVKQIVSGVRTVRNQKNIAPKEALTLQAVGTNKYEAYGCVIRKMANLATIDTVTDKDAAAAAFMVGTDEFAVPLGDMIDIEAETAKLEAQLKHLEGFLAGIRKKLSNEKFVANAPEAVVAMERKKQSDSEEKIAAIKESLAALKKN